MAEIEKRVMDEFPIPKDCCAKRRSKIEGLQWMAKKKYTNEKKKEYENTIRNQGN